MQRLEAERRQAFDDLAKAIEADKREREARVAKLSQHVNESMSSANANLEAEGFDPPGRDLQNWEHLARIVEKEPDPMTLGEIYDWAMAWADREKLRLKLARTSTGDGPMPVDERVDSQVAEASDDVLRYPGPLGPEPGVTWRQYVDNQHRHMEACAPPGWEGLLAGDQPRTVAEVGPWLRRELGSILLMGEKGHGAFWLERANELLRNSYRLLDMFKVWGAPQQPKTVNDPNEIERAIRSLAEWCQRHEAAQSQRGQAQQSPRIVGAADTRREDQCEAAKPGGGSAATRAKPSTAKGEDANRQNRTTPTDLLTILDIATLLMAKPKRCRTDSRRAASRVIQA